MKLLILASVFVANVFGVYAKSINTIETDRTSRGSDFPVGYDFNSSLLSSETNGYSGDTGNILDPKVSTSNSEVNGNSTGSSDGSEHNKDWHSKLTSGLQITQSSGEIMKTINMTSSGLKVSQGESGLISLSSRKGFGGHHGQGQWKRGFWFAPGSDKSKKKKGSGVGGIVKWTDEGPPRRGGGNRGASTGGGNTGASSGGGNSGTSGGGGASGAPTGGGSSGTSSGGGNTGTSTGVGSTGTSTGTGNTGSSSPASGISSGGTSGSGVLPSPGAAGSQVGGSKQNQLTGIPQGSGQGTGTGWQTGTPGAGSPQGAAGGGSGSSMTGSAISLATGSGSNSTGTSGSKALAKDDRKVQDTAGVVNTLGGAQGPASPITIPIGPNVNKSSGDALEVPWRPSPGDPGTVKLASTGADINNVSASGGGGRSETSTGGGNTGTSTGVASCTTGSTVVGATSASCKTNGQGSGGRGGGDQVIIHRGTASAPSSGQVPGQWSFSASGPASGSDVEIVFKVTKSQEPDNMPRTGSGTLGNGALKVMNLDGLNGDARDGFGSNAPGILLDSQGGHHVLVQDENGSSYIVPIRKIGPSKGHLELAEEQDY